MNEILKKKLMDEKALTAADSLELDVALEQNGDVAGLVEAISAIQPPLEWRSGLSERIHAEAKKSNRKRGLQRLMTVGCTLCAAALFAVMIIGERSHMNSSMASGNDSQAESVEERMVQFHIEAENQASLGVQPPVPNGSVDFDWASLESR